MSLKCKLFGHKADRGSARHDGQDFWTGCIRCNARLIRAFDGWREPTEPEIAYHQNSLAEQVRVREASDARPT